MCSTEMGFVLLPRLLRRATKSRSPVVGDESGAGDGIRTRDINLGKVALYQLSYSRSEALFHFCSGFGDLSIQSGACGCPRTFWGQNGADFHSLTCSKGFCS